MNSRAIIVEAIIRDSKLRVLLLKRSSKNNHDVGKWQLPGGKANFGEDITKAIAREVKEELGFKIYCPKIQKCFKTKSCTGKKSKSLVFVFSCTAKGKIKLSNDHSGYNFFNEAELKKIKITNISRKALKKE